MASTKSCAYLSFVSSLLDLTDYAIISLPHFLFTFNTINTIQSSIEVDRLSLPFSLHVSLEQCQIDQLFLGIPSRVIRELGSGLLIDGSLPLL